MVPPHFFKILKNTEFGQILSKKVTILSKTMDVLNIIYVVDISRLKNEIWKFSPTDINIE